MSIALLIKKLFGYTGSVLPNFCMQEIRWFGMKMAKTIKKNTVFDSKLNQIVVLIYIYIGKKFGGTSFNSSEVNWLYRFENLTTS